MCVADAPTLEPDGVIVLLYVSTFCDYTVGTLPHGSVKNSSSGV